MSVPKSSSDERTRNWTAIVYPDSAPENWREILDDQHIQWAESPLHDLDTNADGELKKAHWHIVLAFEGKKSREQIISILAPLHCPSPQYCHSLTGATRYLVHMDNPEKAQYSVSGIVAHGGFDLAKALEPTSARRYELIKEMQAWCLDTGCIEFSDLLDHAADQHADDWFPLLCDSAAYVMQAYLRSRRFKSQSGTRQPLADG